MLDHFAQKLPVSRMQRDLSDSTVLRGLGTAFGHAVIAYEATLRALGRITVNAQIMDAELDNAWEVHRKGIGLRGIKRDNLNGTNAAKFAGFR